MKNVAIVSAAAFATIYYSLQKVTRELAHNETFYEKYLMPALRKLDAEFSHELAVVAAKYVFFPQSPYEDPKLLVNNVMRLPGTTITLINIKSKETSNERKIGHLTFKNPLGISAGFDKNAEAVSFLQNVGFGFLEIGTVTPLPQVGNKKPRLFRLERDHAIINRYGFNSHGHDAVYERLKKLKESGQLTCPLGVNLGKNKESRDECSDYVRGIRLFGDVADYFVLNVSSPNTPGLRDLQKRDKLAELLRVVLKEKDSLPSDPKPLVFLKLSPDLSRGEMEDVAEVLKNNECKVDGLIISNTTIQRDLHLKSENAEEIGGLSGKPLRNLSTKMISDMKKMTGGSLPIIGVGGIFSGKDAYEKMEAGAILVQIYTAFAYHGPPIVTAIKKEMCELLSEKNVRNPRNK